MNRFLIIGLASLGLFGLMFVTAEAQQQTESGINYDSIHLGTIVRDGITYTNVKSTTLVPDRVFDGNDWVNYVWSETAQYIRFESEGISFEFYKDTCDFKLYPEGLIGTNNPDINSYSTSLKRNGIEFPLPACNVINFTQEPNSIHFEAVRGIFSTIFDVHYTSGAEWTHVVNGPGNNGNTFTITDSCPDCNVVSIDGDIITTDNYTLDTKNKTHGKLTVINSSASLFLEFAGTITGNNDLVIDPTFSDNNPTVDGHVREQNNNDVCDVSGSYLKDTTDTIFLAGVQDTGSTVDCWHGFSEYDITIIPDTDTVLDVDFDFDITNVISARDCDYIGMDSQPSVASDGDIFSSVASDTVLLNADSTCTTAGNNKSVDLGALGDTYIQGKLAGNWAAIGVKIDDETLDAGSDHRSDFASEDDGAATPKPTLTIEHGVPPPPTAIESDFLSYEIENIGDKFNVTGSINITTGTHGINITQIVFSRNGTTVTTNSTDQNFTDGNYYPVNFGPFWYRATNDNENRLTVEVTLQNTTNTVTNSTNVNQTREYDPLYSAAIENPGVQGNVNVTLSRFNDNDGINIKTNRQGGTLGDTWQIECIAQNTGQAIANSTAGEWINRTDVGYLNASWSGFTATHAYISCYNDDLLWSGTSYTNSSLAVLGIAAFDDSFGSFIGVPVGVFFVVMAAGAATQRTAPTYIVIILAIIGVMSTIGFFSLDSNVWALALIAGMLGLFVGRKFV